MDIKNLTEEELVKAVSSSTKPKRKKKNFSVARFIKRFNIQRGIVRFPSYLIYYIYMTDKTENGDRKIGKTAFFRHFNEEFEQVRNGQQRYYKLNWSLEITDELKDKARKYDLRFQSANIRRRHEKSE